MARFALIASMAMANSANATVIKVGQDVDWPNYAYEDANGTLQGIGKDFIDWMTNSTSDACKDLTFEVVKVKWSDCWGSGSIGGLLDDGTLHACTVYTHTRGVRNDFCEFSDAFLNDNKPAGLLTMLKDGKPTVNGSSDLGGVKVVDVAGWAPTADGIVFVENKCTSTKYSTGLSMITPPEEGNDAAMKILREGGADAMFLYADQAVNYACDSEGKDMNGNTPAWNCSLWKGFGTEYAYVQTGQTGFAFNGTTLLMFKKGSGMADVANACLAELLKTEDYYKTCKKHGFEGNCYKNQYFPGGVGNVPSYAKPTSQLTGDCSTGYCACPGTPDPTPTPAEKTSTDSVQSLLLSSFIAFALPSML